MKALVVGLDRNRLAGDEVGGLDGIAANAGAGGARLRRAASLDAGGIQDQSQIHEQIEVRILVEVDEEGILIHADHRADDIPRRQDQSLIQTTDGCAGDAVGQHSAQMGVEPEIRMDGAIIADGEVDVADVLQRDANQDGLCELVGGLHGRNLDLIKALGLADQLKELVGDVGDEGGNGAGRGRGIDGDMESAEFRPEQGADDAGRMIVHQFMDFDGEPIFLGRIG